jgi:hypothetical protein
MKKELIILTSLSLLWGCSFSKEIDINYSNQKESEVQSPVKVESTKEEESLDSDTVTSTKEQSDNQENTKLDSAEKTTESKSTYFQQEATTSASQATTSESGVNDQYTPTLEDFKSLLRENASEGSTDKSIVIDFGDFQDQNTAPSTEIPPLDQEESTKISLFKKYQLQDLSIQEAKNLNIYPDAKEEYVTNKIGEFSLDYMTFPTEGLEEVAIDEFGAYYLGPIYQITPSRKFVDYKYKAKLLPLKSKKETIKSLGQAVEILDTSNKFMDSITYTYVFSDNCKRATSIYFGEQSNLQVDINCMTINDSMNVSSSKSNRTLVANYYNDLAYNLDAAYKKKDTNMTLQQFKDMYKDVMFAKIYKLEQKLDGNFELIVNLYEGSSLGGEGTNSFYKVVQSIVDGKIKTVSSTPITNLENFKDFEQGFTLSLRNNKVHLDYKGSQILNLCETVNCMHLSKLYDLNNQIYSFRLNSFPEYSTTYIFNANTQKLKNIDMSEDVFVGFNDDFLYSCNSFEFFGVFVKKFELSTLDLIEEVNASDYFLKCLGYDLASQSYSYLQVPNTYSDADVNYVRGLYNFDYYDLNNLPSSVLMGSI